MLEVEFDKIQLGDRFLYYGQDKSLHGMAGVVVEISQFSVILLVDNKKKSIARLLASSKLKIEERICIE